MKNNFVKILMICIMSINLTGCSAYKDMITDIAVTSMNFSAEVSSTIDAKVESSSCNSKSVKIIYDNGVTFTTTFSGNIETCSFEGSKEIIDAKIMDFTKTCFYNFNPQQLQK